MDTKSTTQTQQTVTSATAKPQVCPECGQVAPGHKGGCTIGASFKQMPAAPVKAEAPAAVHPVAPFAEAPYSCNARWISPHGSVQQHTFRASTFEGYIARLEQLENYLMSKGYQPAPENPRYQNTPTPASPDPAHAGEAAPLCVIHNKPMVKRSKDGRSWWSCTEKLSDGQWCQYRPKDK